ncbi:MAG: hypothetical protein EU530_02175 [Promethearchaeota archaeon]|nr:MAG: hypothetical protein EU530_02175 [Candidatus Lokiarchaeota archaeon]
MSESDENFSNVHSAEHKDVKSRSALCISFYLIISISCYALFIGGLWAILDVIQPTGKWEWFKSLWQDGKQMLVILLAGGFGIVGVVGVLMLWFLYPKGTKLIHKMLYPPITKEEFEKGNFLARFITAGLLISIFVIVVGSVLTLVELVVIESGSFIAFLYDTPNGLLIMLFSSILVVFTILVVVFTWVWINGYQKTLKWIADSNASIDRTEIDTAEWTTGVTLYIIILISILGAAFGGAWYGMQAFSDEINWLNFGTTTLVIGGLASLVFLALIGGLVLFSRGSYTICRMLFVVRRKMSDKISSPDDKKYVKTITITLLIAIALLIIGTVGILVELLMNLASGGTETFYDFLIGLPSYGIWVSIFSGMLFAGIWVLIFIIFTWSHGFFAFFNLIGRKILRDNEKIERDLHSKAQVAFGVIVYLLIWVSVLGIVYGAIWWGLEYWALQPSWTTVTLSLKFLAFESMGSILFLLLTGGLLLARRLVFFISKMLFVRREDIPKQAEKADKIFAGIFTVALLVAIALVFVGSFGILVDYLVDPTIVNLVLLQPSGVLIMIISGMTLVSMWILIFCIFIFTHGYFFFFIRFLQRILKQ